MSRLALIVRHAFGAYQPGERITDPHLITAILAGESEFAVTPIVQPEGDLGRVIEANGVAPPRATISQSPPQG